MVGFSLRLCRLRPSSTSIFELCLPAGVLRFILYAQEEARLQRNVSPFGSHRSTP